MNLNLCTGKRYTLTVEPVSLHKFTSFTSGLVIGDNPCQMSHSSEFPAHCRYTCQWHLRHSHAFAVSQIFSAGTVWEPQAVVTGCRRKPLCQPFMGRPLYGRSASLLELLHTRHNACPGEMIALPFVMLTGTRLQQWQELGGCAKT